MAGVLAAPITTIPASAAPGHRVDASMNSAVNGTPSPSRTSAAPVDADLEPAYEVMIRDLSRHFWDPSVRTPRIRATNGAEPRIGEVARGGPPSFWQMAAYANVLFWDFKLTRSRAARTKLKDQWDSIGEFWTHRQLASASPATGLMNASDDAAWGINYLLQVHEATGSPGALADARALLPNILDRWADPAAPRVAFGRLRASPHGILYVTADGDPSHQQVSSIFESMIANAAMVIHRETGDADCLAYARATFDWSRRLLKQEATGLYFIELDLRPKLADGSANRHYLRPIGDNFGPPVRGLDATYLAGVMSMGVLASRLYKTTHDPSYLAEARSTARAIVGPGGYLRRGDRLVNSRDPWTDGYWAPAYAMEVLTLPGVDPDRRLRAAMINTAASILAQRTADGFYGADWTGPERNPLNGAATWIEEASLRTGSGSGQALPAQIMTSATSAAMAQGGLMAQILDRRERSRRAPGSPP